MSEGELWRTYGPRSWRTGVIPVIAGGAQVPGEDDDPSRGGDAPQPGDASPGDDPSPAPDPMAEIKSLRDAQEKTNKLLGQVLEENEKLRRGNDAATLREGYRPTLGAEPAREPPRDDPATQLEKMVTEGLEETERMAPTAKTVAKMLVKAAPVFGQFVDERLAAHEYRRQLDEDFWALLSEDPNWNKKSVRELKKRHAKRVAQLSVELFVDQRTKQTKAEYLNDPDKALQELKGALERELNIASEDAPSPARPRARAATGDQPGARVQTTRAPESEAELEKTIGHAMNTPAPSRRR